ncbi:trans-aconitate 2-methyltransferase [Prauserella cavernicola]|uniref:Trans-aconitate 2-methyltransferase n=1 Tax=Prauserella cavernicola TaxID=2800127 RepID=A0A934QWG9_9PSEU|nr:trans-aconitate 2-methyltransferase [Prauserella cavernicola]MBK1786584.1 trans-aconitate 2-methyltransferase [Prauserella cavernicola]
MWDPAKYLDYGDLRARPFYDLVARVDAQAPRRVTDLGCGPGNLTKTLAKRWPGATVEAIDGSPEMVAAARESGVAAEQRDVREWSPSADTDVVVTNAVLHWVPEHRDLLRRWVGELPSGAWFAMQVPGNMGAPSHTLTRQLAESPDWADKIADVVLREDDAVDTPLRYADLFADLGCAVDAWETTYTQRLAGENAVLEWITGTALRPVRAALDDQEWEAFRSRLAPLLDEAYPPRADGTTWFPFRRVFAVARVP